MQKSIAFSVPFFLRVGTTNMAATYCYERIPLRFLALLFDIQIPIYQVVGNAVVYIGQKERITKKALLH